MKRRAWTCAALVLWAVGAAATHDAEAGQSATPSSTPTLCEQPVPEPVRMPPADSGPVVYLLGLCFLAQGNVSLIDPATYLYHVQLRPSRPSQNEWTPYDDEAIAVMKQDFARLWATNFLDDLKIEAADYVFANGVVGKLITYHLEERQRVKMVSYTGSTKLDRSKLDEQLREAGAELRLDTFLSAGTIKRVETAIREQLAEKGLLDAEVTHVITELPGGPKLVSVTFNVLDGPKLLIRDVQFVGNRAIRDDELESVLKFNRAEGLLSKWSGAGRYKSSQFAEDAQRLEDYYRDRGYVDARIGEPVLRQLYESGDGATRWIQLRIPVTEGPQYRVARLEIEGNTVVETSLLRRLFTLEPGDWYRQEAIRDFLEKARELYGANGYMEFTGYPDITPTDGGTAGAPAAPPQSLAAVGPTPGADASAPTVDVVLRLSEGHQYIVNRITFSGNVTTRDSVIRREMRLLEGGVFNTEALKASVRRLNQLGYFKPLTGSDKDLKVEKAAGREDAVDIGIKIEELNRNQMTFGAGMSQYEGLFGNVSFTTANFLGRGESVTVSAQKGMRASNYQVSVTEPAVFDGRFSAGFNVFSSKVDLYSSANVVGFSQVREGASLTVGRRVFRSSRIFANYAYEIINVAASKDFASTTSGTTSAYFYGLAESGRYTESRIGPSFEYNTVDNPLRPRSGVRVTASLPVAGGLLGGTANYVKPELETVLYIPHTRRTAFGFRANVAAIQPFGKTSTLPYYLRYFLGGEYQIRGVNIRTVGPANAQGQAIGGNKFVLFNAEYYLDMFGPVRMVLFHDAGQAYDERHSIDLRQLRTSSGVEARFTVPALNVPFRLIYSWNIYRDVFQPARGFRFAVGTTF